MPQVTVGKKIKVFLLQIIRVSDLDAILKIFGKTPMESLEHIGKMFETGHLVFVQVFELKHEWSDMVTKWLQKLQESFHQFSGEEMWIGNQWGAFLFVVMMGESDAIRDLDAKDKSRWYRC